MRPSRHVALSFAVSVVFGAWSGSWPAAMVCFASGILIDLDHHLDYWIVRKQFPWRYTDLWSYFMEVPIEKVYVLFHSWEQQAVLWACIGAFDLGLGWTGFALGMTTHMMADALANPLRPFGYFLAWRLAVGFDAFKILRKDFTGHAS